MSLHRKPAPLIAGQYSAVPSRNTSPGSRYDSRLPAYDKANGMRIACMIGLCFSWVISIAAIAVTPWVLRGSNTFVTSSGDSTVDKLGQRTVFLGAAGQEAVKLATNVAISVCTDCLGYIHSTSYRWALERESRLEFNSNLRLLANTRTCSANRWSTNVVFSILLMLCYVASSQLFLGSSAAAEQNFVLNGVAIAVLGFGILGQAALSTVCLFNAGLIPTWSSNPLNTALVMLHQRRLRRRAGRCMLSVHLKEMPSVPTQPSARQRRLRAAHAAADHIVLINWILVVLSIVWSVIVYAVSRKQNNSLSPGPLYFYGYGEDAPIIEFYVVALLIVAALQASITLAIHSVELLVNMSRDEKTWRQARSRSGATMSNGGLGSAKAALFSWESLVLSALKPLIHWLFGLSITMADASLFMSWQAVLSLSGLISVLALFATFLSRRSPLGKQPSTFGHLQTLVDLIDVWPETARRPIWWGDKGPAESHGHVSIGSIYHAGTSTKGLEDVRKNRKYSGCYI